MDLLSIAQSLWRRKLIAIPILLLTGILAIYVVKVKPPTYKSTGSVLSRTRPEGPTPAQVAAHPSLKAASSYNTFVDYGDLTVIANTVMDLVGSATSQPALAQAGVIPGYSLGLSSDYGNPPIIDITGVGQFSHGRDHECQCACRYRGEGDLYLVQQSEGINPFYMVKNRWRMCDLLLRQKSSSGALRSLIAILAVGVILLFLVISVADALEKRRKTDGFTGRPSSGAGQAPRNENQYDSAPEDEGRDPRPRGRRHQSGAALTRSEDALMAEQAPRRSGYMDGEQHRPGYPATPGYRRE